MDNIVLNKVATIEKCIKRINEEYLGFEQDFQHNFSKQDAAILNIQRASQACIDLAMHIVRVNKLGLPQNSRDVFVLLEQNNIINHINSVNMQKMVGFRNIAIHSYQELEIDIIVDIITHKLTDYKEFVKEILQNENYTIFKK